MPQRFTHLGPCGARIDDGAAVGEADIFSRSLMLRKQTASLTGFNYEMNPFSLFVAGLLTCTVTSFAYAEAAADFRPHLSMPSSGNIVASRGTGVVEIRTISTSSRNPDEDPEPEFSPPDSFGERLGRSLLVSLAQSEVRDIASGFILTSDGYIVSSAHVLWDAEEIHVRLQNGQHFPAVMIGLDRTTDVALLKIEATGLSPAPIGDSSRLAVGDWVAAISSPFGLEGSVTAGIVSAKDRFLSTSGETGFIQTDVAINPGSSGSPLFNASGEIVALNALIYSGSGGYMGLSFSVPINLVVDIARRLRSQGYVQRVQLGAKLQGMSSALAQSFGVSDPTGLLVVQVTPGGPAERAGLKSGDIITAFNNVKIMDFSSLSLQMSDVGSDVESVIEVWRSKRKTRFAVTLEKTSASNYGLSLAPQVNDLPNLGLTLSECPQTSKAQACRNGGLLVREAAGFARSEGIQAGDVIVAANELKLGSAEEFSRLISRLEAGSGLALLVIRDNQAAYIPLLVPSKAKLPPKPR